MSPRELLNTDVPKQTWKKSSLFYAKTLQRREESAEGNGRDGAYSFIILEVVVGGMARDMERKKNPDHSQAFLGAAWRPSW